MALHGVAEWVKQPRARDRLTEARQRLKQTLRDQERQGRGAFLQVEHALRHTAGARRGWSADIRCA
jgi:hypothetical protein